MPNGPDSSDDARQAGPGNSADPLGRPLRLDGAFTRKTFDDWQQAANASLKDGRTLDDLARHTLDDLRIDTLYDSSPIDGRWVPSIAADPLRPARERRDWDNRLRIMPTGDNAEKDANSAALIGLTGGVTSLEFVVRDSIDAASPVGALPLSGLDKVLDGVHVEMVSLSLDAGDDTMPALDALLKLCRQRKFDPSNLAVSLNADPLGTLAREGTVAGGLDAAFQRMTDIAQRAAETLPLAYAVTTNLCVHHDAGASTVQELVAGIASATQQLERLLDAGLDSTQAVRTMCFRISLDANIVEGVVKLRALERLWRHVLGQFSQAFVPVVSPVVVAETSQRHLSRLEPWVNHLRNIAACTAAAIGNADTILVNPHDRIDGIRIGEDAAIADRVARNLPILLTEEAGLRDVADAAGGAHAIESLTQATVESVWQGLGELQQQGGLSAAIEAGSWPAALARTQTARIDRLVSNEALRIGVNHHRPADAPALDKLLPSGSEPQKPATARDATHAGSTRAFPRVREASLFESKVSMETST